MDITQDHLKSILKYAPDTGVFSFIETLEEAGSISRANANMVYRRIYVGGTSYLAHRLAFLYMDGFFPEYQVDHINRDGLDNRWENLRRVTSLENSRNRGAYKNNSSGVPGVSFYCSSQRWVAKIDIPGKRFYLGTFKDFFEACCARKSAERRLNFHINYGRS